MIVRDIQAEYKDLKQAFDIISDQLVSAEAKIRSLEAGKMNSDEIKQAILDLKLSEARAISSWLNDLILIQPLLVQEAK